MARKKKIKIKLTEKLLGQLEKVHDELIARGANDFNLVHILERLMQERGSQTIIDEFVNEHTPNNYKIAKLLETPEERERILKILENKSFGLSVSEAHAN